MASEIAPVRKSVRVRANVERAFRVFTLEMDSWWPKSHHIGSSPMTKAVVEGWVGGRCYSEQADGTDCPWGQVLAWEPPSRFVMAWQVNPTWQYEADLAKCSEIEVNFTPTDDGTTLVELEHRYFERHGEGAEAFREGIGAPNGWGALLELYSGAVSEEEMKTTA